MKLVRKTNRRFVAIGMLILFGTAVRAILELDFGPDDIRFWLILLSPLIFLSCFTWRQSRTLAYVTDGRIFVRGEEIDQTLLEYWFYRKVEDGEYELILQYRGFNPHHISLFEHDETFNGDRFGSFLRANLSAPERTDLSGSTQN